MNEEKGPLIVLILFAILAAVFGFLGYSNQGELDGEEGQANSKQDEINKINEDIALKEADIKDYEVKIAGLRKKIQDVRALTRSYVTAEKDYRDHYELRRKLRDFAQEYVKNASDLKEKIEPIKSEVIADINKRKDEQLRDLKDKAQKMQEEKDAADKYVEGIKASLVADNKTFLINKSFEQSNLDEARNIQTDLTQREVEHASVMMEADGEVILSDIINNTIVINLGTADGVHNGYRFECYALRPGNNKVRKAYLEVRQADRNSSACMIIKKPLYLPTDPNSEFVGEPGDLYSPYQESGRKGASAQPLSGRPIMQKDGGMDWKDPIVAGDLILNPFLKPGQKFSYYIAGAKEQPGERQKSAIRYTRQEIKAVAESYGNTVVDTVDTNVKYIIAQKNPKDDPEFQKAVDHGIPVIYEWELFPFLDVR